MLRIAGAAAGAVVREMGRPFSGGLAVQSRPGRPTGARACPYRRRELRTYVAVVDDMYEPRAVHVYVQASYWQYCCMYM
jgi:hypothetical protein